MITKYTKSAAALYHSTPLISHPSMKGMFLSGVCKRQNTQRVASFELSDWVNEKGFPHDAHWNENQKLITVW